MQRHLGLEAMQAAASGESGASIDQIDHIVGARAGDPDALASLYRAYGAALYRLAYRLTGTPQDAEDVVHDVFVGLPEALGRYEERGSFAGWLKRVTARVALMRLRTRTRRREVMLNATLPADQRPADVESMALETAINALPDRLRSVLVLKEVEGYSHAEVSELLGISEGTSRVRLNRAMKRLRRMLENGT
ncbi:MAG: RNA polymerase sigma factor SigE [Gemmatimonadetes bacterium]|nr:MAG: RNA polymerase sigma factor SigE [Gemmatimonadota bacterium]